MLRFSRHILYNLSRPEKSLLLLAPLAAEAGGLGLCKDKDTPATVFADTRDPDCQKLLAAIQDAARRLDEMKRFDMPGFRPRAEYVREMQRYGILPRELDPQAPLDPYALDRAYWRSLWYRPAPAPRAAREP